MAVEFLRIFRTSKLNGAVCFLFLIFLGSYMFGFWSVNIASNPKNGKSRYNVVLTLNLTNSATSKTPILTTPTPFRNRTDISPYIAEDPRVIRVPQPRSDRSYSCAKLIQADSSEQARVLQTPDESVFTTPDEKYIDMTSDCPRFRTERAYTMHALSQDEAQFPIAYSILMFKDVEQFERLLRAVYRPQNYYCIHVDLKSSDVIHQAVQGIASCFDNVFVMSVSVDVRWAYFSVVEPELMCMKELIKYKKWKYFINLTGQEFPLKTNGEIVEILKVLNGANNLEGTVKRRNKGRTLMVHNGMSPTKLKKGPVPVPVTLSKGSVHVIVQRGFVEYLLFDKRALAFIDWVKDTGVPDETLFSSLNYSPQLEVPGAYLGETETDHIDVAPPGFPRNPFIARFKNWGDGPFNWPCGGKRVRMVCIFGVKDLPMLSRRLELFANKFYTNYQTEAYECIEELHFNRTRAEITDGVKLDLSFYKKLDIVHNHIAGNVVT